MANKYLTVGELATLSGTTKRTIQFYDKKGILKPAKVNTKKYRFYLENQVLDFQRILLLATLGVTLDEMKKYLRKNGKLSELFDNKKALIEKEIRLLEFNSQSLTKFQNNLKANGTMVSPKIKSLPSFGVFYIEKVGPYANIGEYCQELSEMFENRGSNFTTLAIFDDPTYQPKQSKIKVGALSGRGMKIKEEYKNIVKYMDFNPGKVITYTHNGAGNLLSLFWKELEKYGKLNNITVRKNVSDFEIYREVNADITKQFFEIYLPIN